jgi:hypothetical protein
LSVRFVVSLLALALLAGGFWWTTSVSDDATAPGVGSFHVSVVGRDGVHLANGTVLAKGTPLDVLQALADEQGFIVETEQQAWIGGGCTATYVLGIAGQRETKTGGWNYYTRGPGEEWSWGPSGAACHRLTAGEQVEWCWVESDVCEHHAP